VSAQIIPFPVRKQPDQVKPASPDEFDLQYPDDPRQAERARELRRFMEAMLVYYGRKGA